MIQNFDELAQYIRQNLPQPKSITNLQLKEKSGVVTFQWHGREFAIKKSLEVLEIKGQGLFITGASMLMQSALTKVGKDERLLDSMIDALQEAETLINDQPQRESGLKLLETVKATLRKMATA